MLAAALAGCASQPTTYRRVPAPNDGLRWYRYNPVTHSVDDLQSQKAVDALPLDSPENARRVRELDQEIAKREAWLESHGMRHVEFQDIPINAPETGTRHYPDGSVEHVFIPAP